jgi:hypothetical protein
MQPDHSALIASLDADELAEFDAAPGEATLQRIVDRRTRRTNPFAHARLLERRQQAAQAQSRALFLRGQHPSQKGTK